MRPERAKTSRSPAKNPAVLAELALGFALLAVAFVGARTLLQNWRETEGYRSTQAEWDDFRPSGHPLFRSLGGITAKGRKPILLEPQKGIPRYVVFVLRSSSLQQEISTWAAVQRRLAAAEPVKLVGYCMSSECTTAVAKRKADTPFTIIGYTAYRTARVVASAGLAHRALVLDASLVSRGSVKWSDTERAGEILKSIQRLL